MPKASYRLTRFISWWDILIGGIISWIIKRILDFLFERASKRVRKVDRDSLYHSLSGFWSFLIESYITFFMVSYSSIYEEEFVLSNPSLRVIFTENLRGILRLHRFLHRTKRVKEESCKVCLIIAKRREYFQKMVLSKRLYPPFPF